MRRTSNLRFWISLSMIAAGVSLVLSQKRFLARMARNRTRG